MIQPGIEACLWLSLFAAPWGSLLIFRRLSYFGDAVGHSSLFGVALAFLFFGLAPVPMAIGALLAVLLTTGLISFFEKKSKLPADIALTISYAGLFAMGLVVLGRTRISLEHFMFGDLSLISSQMLWFLRVWSLLVMAALLLFWRPLWATVQDLRFARLLGYPVRVIEALFLVITAVSVVGLMLTVGILLVTAYFVLPAVAALPWSRSLSGLVVMSIVFALVSSLVGYSLSHQLQIQAGAAIASTGFILTLLSHGLRVTRS